MRAPEDRPGARDSGSDEAAQDCDKRLQRQPEDRAQKGGLSGFRSGGMPAVRLCRAAGSHHWNNGSERVSFGEVIQVFRYSDTQAVRQLRRMAPMAVSDGDEMPDQNEGR